MHKFIKYSVCFFIALLFLSCNNDELEKNQENAKVTKTNLKLEKFSNPNIAKNVEADFENVNEIRKDDFKISEFAAKEKVVNRFASDLLQNQLKYQGVTIENEGIAHSYFLEVYGLEKSAVYPETITKLNDFSGTLNVYSFDGKNLGSVAVTKGEAKNISEKQELDVLTKAINLFSVSSNTTNRIPPCNTPYYQPMQFTIYWHTEVIVDNKVISYVLSNVTTETIVVETSYPCDASPQEVGRAYRYEIIGRSGAGGSGTTPPPVGSNIVIYAPVNVLGTISEYLKCFKLNENAQLTIYVDQPIPNKEDAYTGITNVDVGHTFIAIQQGNIRRVMGFYPASEVGPVNTTADMAFSNDGGHNFDVSISVSINATQLSNIVNYIKNAPKKYDLNSYNCTDFGISVGNLAGLGLPDAYGTWPNGGGSNPGALGQYIRSMTVPAGGIRQTTSASAGSNNGNCN